MALDRLIKNPWYVIIALSVFEILDVITTYYAITKKGFVELNPLMAPYVTNLISFFILKMVIVVVTGGCLFALIIPHKQMRDSREGTRRS